MRICEEMIGYKVELLSGEQGELLAYLGPETTYPYSIAIVSENSTTYRFVNERGYQVGDVEPFIVSVLEATPPQNFFKQHIDNRDHQGDLLSKDIVGKDVYSDKRGEIGAVNDSDTTTLTLTIPEGTNVLEGEFKANNGKIYKVSVKHE